jgi:putative oxidoreductase
MFKPFLRTDNSLAQLFIRLALGVVIFPHGAQKVFGLFGGGGIQKTLHTFSSMGFPAWSTACLMVVETLGAVLLVGGFLTRLWAFAIGMSLSICMYLYHLRNGFFMNWSGQLKGEGFEYHLLALGICIALLIRGGGALSVDRTLAQETNRYHY